MQVSESRWGGRGSSQKVWRDAPILPLPFAQQTKLSLLPQLDPSDALGLGEEGEAGGDQEVIRRGGETVQIEL